MTNDNDARGALTFRKKPVVIEAFRLGHDNMPDWFCEARSSNSVTTHNTDGRFRGGPDYALISTLEGQMRAEYGDWIIRGIKGELYPCKPDIFAQTYEPAAQLPAGDGLTRKDKALLSLCERIEKAAGREPIWIDGSAADAIRAILAAPRQPGEMIVKCTRCEYIGKCDCQPGEMGAGVQTTLYVECNEYSHCGHVGINDSSDTEDACGYPCGWHGPSQKEDKCPGCQREGVMVSACPNCGNRYSILAERDVPIPAASAQQDDGGDETKWNCHCGNANCAGLHPNDASAQQDEPTPAQPISDAMMDLVDRLGSEAANVDPRAWRHLLVYAPEAAQQDEREADAKALKDASEWLLDVMGDWDLTIPNGAFDKIVVYIAKGDHNG